MGSKLIKDEEEIEDPFVATIFYDAIGNIERLQRRGPIYEYDAPQDYIYFDDLHYTYDSEAERLLSVFDLIHNNDFGYKQGNASYEYDNNGNPIKISGEETTEITYNILNLPYEITKNGITVENTYSASGTKLRHLNQENEERLYLGSFELLNGNTDLIKHAEGYLRLGEEEYHAEYLLRDHLGNTVVTFQDKDGDGKILSESQSENDTEIEVLDRYLYYPFGLTAEGQYHNQSVSLPEAKYKYNGKEKDDFTGFYDFHARTLDVSVGRFLQVDPLAEKYTSTSPYAYVLNNPLRFTDPTGMSVDNSGPGDPPSVAGIIYEAFQNARVGLFNTEMRALELFGYGSETHSLRMRVNYNSNGSIPLANPVSYRLENKKGVIGEGVDASLDLLALSPLGASTKAGSSVILTSRLPGLKYNTVSGAVRMSDKVVEFIQGTGDKARKVFANPPAGFRKINAKGVKGKVYTDGKTYISPDLDGHKGGVWKAAKSVKDLGRKDTRLGTYSDKFEKIAD